MRLLLSDCVLKMLEFRLQAVVSARIFIARRLKPELQRPAPGFRHTLSGRLRCFCAITVLVGVCLSLAGPSGLSAAGLEDAFRQPPPEARPWVYWFWMNGNITKEGITADLEAMERVGIGGTLIMSVGAGIPAGPVRFLTPEWRAMFQHAVAEAERLGLEVTMNNNDGFTGSGGPWIRPDQAMMKLSWSETSLEGPASVDQKLREPPTNLGYYRDVAVLALPAPAGETPTVADLEAKVTASDAELDGSKLVDGRWTTEATLPAGAGPRWIQLEFPEPFTARGLRLVGQMPGGRLEASDDGKAYRTVASFDNTRWWINVATHTISFDEATGRFFRLVPGPRPVTLGEVELIGGARVHRFELKAGFARCWGHGGGHPYFAERRAVPSVAEADSSEHPSWSAKRVEGLAIEREQIVDLAGRMDSTGRLRWEVPQGNWVVLRVGYTPTGETNHPASEGGEGLECDKLSPEGMDAAFAGFMAKLIDDVGPRAGKTLRYSHVDSWETGQQNWTARFRDEFRRRRRYDLLPYLPVMAGGRVVDDLETSERFLWDLRRTIADMFAEYNLARMRRLCNEHGLGFSGEPSGAQQFLYDPINFQREADFPMGEFWVNQGRPRVDCKAASSVAHVFDKPLVGAEAFTAGPAPGMSRWQSDPFSLKALGDEAFCYGVNRFVFHRYAMQPWQDKRPGMTMGPWGIHFERTNTWWEQGAAWMSYLARCQQMLRQGRFVADVCVFSGEGAPNYLGRRDELNPPLPPGYDYDGVNADVILNRMSVEDGRIVLPNGMRYRLLLLPDERTMTPGLLEKIRELVRAGAVVVGPKPLRSPSLAGYPECDRQVERLADDVWGDCDGEERTEHAFGRGKVFWGKPFEEIFAAIGLVPDFECTGASDPVVLNYLHRRTPGAEIYFVANHDDQYAHATCAFRVADKQPEFWDPETGEIEPAVLYDLRDRRVWVPIRFEPCGSVFVVFRSSATDRRVVDLERDGRPVFPTETEAPAAAREDAGAGVADEFTMAAWVRPARSIVLPVEAAGGIRGGGQSWVVYPPPGHAIYGETHAGAGISIGTNGVCVFEHSARYLAPVLVHQGPVTGWTHVAVAYRDRKPTLFLNGEPVRTGLRGPKIVHPGVGVESSRPTHAFPGNVARLEQFDRPLSDDEIARLVDQTRPACLDLDVPPVELGATATGSVEARVWQPGQYALGFADGRNTVVEVEELPKPFPVDGPWTVQFPPGLGAPESIELEHLVSWAEHADPGVKHFSGTATYVGELDLPATETGADRLFYLDLGRVKNVAEVTLNGQDLGVLWKPPFRVEVTGALQPGTNRLEVRVTNLWPNRLIGDEQFPPDCDYAANGPLAEWPEWMVKGEPRAEPRRVTFTTWKHYDEKSPLLESGLIGPVKVYQVRRVPIEP